MCLIAGLEDAAPLTDREHAAVTAPAAATDDPTTGDRVVMLGVNGGPILSATRSQPAILLSVNGVQYLVDCGGDSARQIVKAGMGFGTLRHVFLTHHHLDHVAGYPELAMLGWMYLRSPLRGLHVWGPPPIAQIHHGVVDAFSFGIDLFERGVDAPPFHTLFTPHEVSLPATGIAKVMEDDEVVVHGTRVFHGDEVKDAYAYRFDIKHSGTAVVFSGDTAGPNAQLVALAEDADLLVHEVQLNAQIGLIVDAAPPAVRAVLREHLETTHTNVADLPRIAKAAGVGRVAMCHYTPGFLPAEEYLTVARAAAVTSHYGGEIIAPTELDVIRI